MISKVIFVHGWESSPKEGWWPWLKKELESRGFEVIAPVLPNSANPNMSKWLNKLKKAIGIPDQNCYFIGHSLGCITVLRYIESLKKQNIGGAVLVAGFTSNLGYDELDSFFKNKINWGKIKSHCEKFTVIHSKNDRYVSLHYGNFFKKRLGAKLLTEEKMGHFTDKDGIKKLPSALKSILEMEKGRRKNRRVRFNAK